MSSSSIVVVDHVYKSYKRPSQIEINRIFQWVGKQIKQPQQPSTTTGHQYVVEDVSFSLQERESLGLIGSNGAGKTTIFRLLAGITLPTRGRIRVMGRVSSLISLGAGFHPELSGRENLFLNCALMGLSHRETVNRMDKIIEFAEIGDHIDLAIKRYSSGMLARLGFSVAVHLDPELILIDEVLSVGDYRFQVKSTAAIRDFIQRGTVILVSHDMGSVERICKRSIWLDQGKIRADGPSQEVIQQYIRAAQHQMTATTSHAEDDLESSDQREDAEFHASVQVFDDAILTQQIEICDGQGNSCAEFSTDDTIVVRCHLIFKKPTVDVQIVIGLIDINTQVVITSCNNQIMDQPDSFYGNLVIEARFAGLRLRPRNYGVYIELSNHKALMPLSIWKDISTRFVIFAENRVPFESAQAGIVYASNVEMRIVELATTLSNSNF